MYVLYLDVFFLHNMVLIAFISCFALQFVMIQIATCWKRVLGTAALGAGIETVLLLICNNYCWFAIGSLIGVMPMIVYFLLRGHKEISRRRMIIISYTMVCLFVGVSSVMQNLLGYDEITQTGVLGILLIMESVILELKRVLREQRHLYCFEIGDKENKIRGTALYDSGNHLRDPWEKRAVHIVSSQLLQQLQLDTPKWMVPYQSLGNGRGVLEVYEAEWLILLSNDKKIRLTNVLIGKAQDGLLKNKQYQMILNEAVFENGND